MLSVNNLNKFGRFQSKSIEPFSRLLAMCSTAILVSACGGGSPGDTNGNVSSSSVPQTSSTPASSSSISSTPVSSTPSSSVSSASSSVAAQSQLVLAINSGGPAASFEGVQYERDRFYTGGSTNDTEDPIGGVSEDAIYQSERFGSYSYEIPVSDARYSLVLHFVELYQTEAGARSFNISIEGQEVLSSVDLYSVAGGHDQAYSFEVDGIEVSDGRLSINLETLEDNATISGFAIYSDNGGEVVEPEPNTALDHLIPSATEVGLKLANRFSRQQLSFNSVYDLPGDGYKSACEWYGAITIANLTDNTQLLDSLIAKFSPIRQNFVNDMFRGTAHVDRYIFGMVPLEIYLQTLDSSYLSLGTQVADRQQTTNQTRDAIDDMFMMTGLQLQAYRATGDSKYLDFMASTMVDYLRFQQSNGLFFHNVNQARTYWGRGNGWFAAGMAEIMRDLPESHQHYNTIESGYMKMMEGLLPFQLDSGLWSQVINLPDDSRNWGESSGTAMFTYAMVAGVKRGVLDATTYVPVIERAWQGLRNQINDNGDVRNVCVGTWYKNSPAEYMALQRLTGDGHGQAPVLWVVAELLR